MLSAVTPLLTMQGNLVRNARVACCNTEDPMQPEALLFEDDGETPNSRLPLLVYKGVLGNALPGTADRDLAAACEDLFQKNGWPPAWRASVHPFSHFHTRCHEALGVVRGSGRVQFGG